MHRLIQCTTSWGHHNMLSLNVVCLRDLPTTYSITQPQPPTNRRGTRCAHPRPPRAPPLRWPRRGTRCHGRSPLARRRARQPRWGGRGMAEPSGGRWEAAQGERGAQRGMAERQHGGCSMTEQTRMSSYHYVLCTRKGRRCTWTMEIGARMTLLG
jgi:hypothetical protein